MSWWSEMPWRLVQTNLREPDFLDLDPIRYAQDLVAFGATVVLVNAAGISASYETELPYHTRNPYLIKPQILGNLVDELHNRGLKVLARTDFSKVPEKIGEEYPEWLYRSKEGKPMLYNGFAQTCINGAYQREYALKILKELFTTIPFDGLYCNMGGFQTQDYSHKEYGFCHCNSCQEAFRIYADALIPKQIELSDPIYHQYLAFQQEVISAYRAKLKQVLKPLSKEDLCLDGLDFDRREVASEINQCPIDFAYHAASNCRTRQQKRILSNADVSFLGFAHRHVSVPPALHQLRLYQTLAQGGSLDYYCMGRLDTLEDRSALGKVKEVFALHAHSSQFFDNTEPVAQVLLRRTNGWVFSEEEKGWITLLTEFHILFTEATEEKLLTLDLQSYSLIILCDSWNLKKTEADLLDVYVQGGGRLLATGRTGFFDAVQGKRKKPLLASLGIRQIHDIEVDATSSLFLVKEAEKTAFFPSLSDIEVLPAGEYFVHVQKEANADTLLSYIPPHPYGPPERCFYPSTSLESGMIQQRYGKGQSLYLPWYPLSFYARTGVFSLRLMVHDIFFTWAKLKTFAVSMPACVELSMSRNQNGTLVLHLVNSSGWHGNPVGEPFDVGPIVLKIPYPSKPKTVVSLMGTEVHGQYEQGELLITLVKLGAYDSIILRETIS
jgi:hypothetical protein